MIQGVSPTLLNVTYIRPDKKREIEESFEIVYKDDGGQLRIAHEPAIAEIYFVKPEYRTPDVYNKPQERLEKLNKHNVLVSQIRYEIAREMGPEGEAFVKQCYENRDWKSLNKLYAWRFAFACDFQPEFYFLKQWYGRYKLGNPRLTKAFIDIEVESIDYIPDLEKLSGSSYSPVNCSTVFLEDTKECFTFILRPYKPSILSYTQEEYKRRYDLYERQLAQHKDLLQNMGTFIGDLNKSFDSMYGFIRYNIREYENEIDLIADIFRLLNDRKPNFCLAWNMRFDIQYLLERIKALGYDPKSIMCHQDFPVPKCYFHIDKMTFALEKQYDYFFCSSYTQYICQMRLYAAIRKSQQMLKSVSLNAIGDRELKDKKVEYDSETNMMMFPYVDWKKFIKYNIKDVLLQVGIERKTNDVMTYYMKSHSNLTPYNKIFRETHLLRNVREMYFNKEGWVQANNLNIIGLDEDDIFYSTSSDEDDDDDSTFKGAILADPTMNDTVGIPILDSPSNVVHANVMDYDMAAFYPSIKIACNMDPGTLLYKAEFNNEIFISGEYSNRSLNTTYKEKDKNGKIRNLDVTGEVVNTFLSGNILTFCYDYLNAPSISELTREVLKELKA